MIIVVGLGNPGKEYEQSRHNLGFDAIDLLAQKFDASFALQSKFNAQVAKVGDILLVKPQTFMNRSGHSVVSVLQFYDKEKLQTKDFSSLILMHDDLDMTLGNWKLVKGSGPKVHNGVNSVREQLGSSEFWYARMGVDDRNGDRSEDPAAYVLRPVASSNVSLVHEMMVLVVDAVYAKISSPQSLAL